MLNDAYWRIYSLRVEQYIPRRFAPLDILHNPSGVYYPIYPCHAHYIITIYPCHAHYIITIMKPICAQMQHNTTNPLLNVVSCFFTRLYIRLYWLQCETDHGHPERLFLSGPILVLWAKLNIPSTLNIDLILWHTQLIVCAVKC